MITLNNVLKLQLKDETKLIKKNGSELRDPVVHPVYMRKPN